MKASCINVLTTLTTSWGVKFCKELGNSISNFVFLVSSQSSENIEEIFRFKAYFGLFVSCPLNYVNKSKKSQ